MIHLDDRASIGQRLEPRLRVEWAGIRFLLGEMEGLRSRGLVDEASYRAIVEEYSARRDELERGPRFEEAMAGVRWHGENRPAQALAFAARARELMPGRPEGWVAGVGLLRRLGRGEEADRLRDEATGKFPDLARGAKPSPSRAGAGPRSRATEGPGLPPIAPKAGPRISWGSVAGEFLQEHWQKLISGLAVLLIVVSSTVGASLVLGPLLWSTAGKVVLGLAYTASCAGFGLGLARWGAGRAGRMMLAASLIVVPINLMLVGDLGLMVGPSTWEIGLVGVDAALLFLLARGIVGALGFRSGGTFTSLYFATACFNAGASTGMPPGSGLAVFLAPGVVFLGAVAWLNRRGGEERTDAEGADWEFGLLALAFLSGVIRTGGAVLQLAPALYAIPAMLAAVAGISTARAMGSAGPKSRRASVLGQGGLAVSALAFALALGRTPGPSVLLSGNTLAVAVLGLALYATSLRATRQPAYLYAGFGALVVAYFGAFSFAADLVRSVEEAARKAMGSDRGLSMPFKAINGLAFNVGLAALARFFARRWSDDRLARHCHYLGLPFSVAACVLGAFEPTAAVICLGGYAALYAVGARLFAEPRLIYLACSATAGSAWFAASMGAGATLGLRSLIASILGLAFWAIRATPPLRRAGEAYRMPLIHAARAMAAAAMLAAAVASAAEGSISGRATLAFGLAATLALLNGRESPRVSIFLLAIGGLLGAWLGGYQALIGGGPATAMGLGLAVAGFAAALLGVGEGVRARWGDSGAPGAYLGAMGWAVPVLVVGSWGLAGGPGVVAVPVARAFLVGGSALIWLTRFRRESVLVYLGLAGLATWAGCLCGLVAPWDRPGLAWGWLAVTWAGSAVASWGAGEFARRRDADFYDRPCFLAAGFLALAAFATAVGARWLAVESYRSGVAAMLGGALALGLVARSRRWPVASGLATWSVVGASYLALLSQGPADPGSAWVLGLVAALEAIACRGAGWLIRRGSRDPDSILARPLDQAALLLTLAAVAPGLDSPATLLAIAGSTALLIGAYPSALWLYGTLLAVGRAVSLGWLSGLSGAGPIAAATLGAYAAWGLAVGLQRAGPGLCRRSGLPGLALDRPPATASLALGALAPAVRLRELSGPGADWSAMAWLPWALAGLCLLRLRFDPRRGWVHGAVGLSGIGVAATLATVLDPQRWWLTSGMIRALAWSAAGLGAWRIEAPIRRRLGIRPGFDSGVLEEWAVASFVLSTAAIAWIVLGASLAGVGPDDAARWRDVAVALGLGAGFAAMGGLRPARISRTIGLEVVGLLAAWWLAAPGSPLLGLAGFDRDGYLATATAVGALAVVMIGRWEVARSDPGAVDPVIAGRAARFASWGGFGLGVASIYLSAWASGRVALIALTVATGALGILAIGRKRVESAVAGGLAWCLSGSLAAVLLARATGRFAGADHPPVAGLGMAAAVATLWWVAGRVRARSGDGGRVASAMERVAIGMTVPSAALAWLDFAGADLVGSGVLVGLAAFYAMVARRRVAGWPVYLAQGLVLGAYFRARGEAFPSGPADAAALSLLGYLDLGLAELMGRLRLAHYARPTLRVALALPMVPVVQAAGAGRWDESGLFVLIATASFYALAGLRMRSRWPAYASAAFCNAALWLGWSLLGWRLGDRPQFYLIPVGFTSILFAEVNRRELGRGFVNGARSLGLVLIYASLAAPIWQSQSFGAWLTLLLLSLAGIFAGIGLRVQTFLWLGLAGFGADLTYQVGRLGRDHALARWGVLLGLGVALMLFVALNEKKRIVATMRKYYDEARGWE